MEHKELDVLLVGVRALVIRFNELPAPYVTVGFETSVGMLFYQMLPSEASYVSTQFLITCAVKIREHGKEDFFDGESAETWEG